MGGGRSERRENAMFMPGLLSEPWTPFCLSPRQCARLRCAILNRGAGNRRLSNLFVRSIDAERHGADFARAGRDGFPGPDWLATIAATSFAAAHRVGFADDRLAARCGAARRPLNPAMRSKPSPPYEINKGAPAPATRVCLRLG